MALLLAARPLVGTAQARPSTASATVADKKSPASRGSLVMVLDSSGSMADDDGSGSTRIETARKAVGTVVDKLPDGYRTGLRVYGADRARGCTDTRLAQPVRPLDRGAIKKAVADVRPKGDTPIGHSLRKAAEDLPDAPRGSLDQRTILLISDGEDTCGEPPPCEAAAELAKKGINLRIDTIGFQVRGKARKQLQCVADSGNGHYYDAPDADALVRQLERAGQLSVDGYRFRGKRVEGGDSPATAAPLSEKSGQYVDSIGLGQTRWYSVEMDGTSTNVFSAAGIPQPGSDQSRSAGLRTKLYGPGRGVKGIACRTDHGYFRSDDGGMPVISSVPRIPRLGSGSGTCDRGAGRYLLSVERRTNKRTADRARWPLELRYDVEKRPERTDRLAPPADPPGAAEEAPLPRTDARRVQGGTGFNDAAKVGTGVWRDKILPGQTLWYRVPVGWGQRLRYDVEFGNEPTVDRPGVSYARIRALTYSPKRQEISSRPGFHALGTYRGTEKTLVAGAAQVSWSNRWVTRTNIRPVHAAGEHYIAVTLSSRAARIAENPDIGITLRVGVQGEARSGPERDAKADASPDASPDGSSPTPAGDAGGGDDSGDGGDGGWSGALVAAVAGGTGLALLAGLGAWYALARRGVRRGSGPR
ncbi:vWA domain-containing protein [Streptomyces boncukensis]|nr:VWA domain-containing protein [Streptomyces boncukensis]